MDVTFRTLRRTINLGMLLTFSCLCSSSHAQGPLPRDVVLKQLYGNYDATAQTATLNCTDAQRIENSETHGSWWPCYKDDSVVSVQIVLMASVADKTYLVTSAVPAHDPAGFECHSCEPAIGVAKFTWRKQEWKLECANAVVGFYGAWGDPPLVNLVAIGPADHGVMLSKDDGGQGYASGSKWLLAPVGNSVAEVWRIQDEQDDFGAYDPKGVDGPPIRYRSVAAIRFGCIFDGDCRNGKGYFDIEVISRGSERSEANASLIAQNWTNVYQFKDGKYKLARRQKFTESKAAGHR